MVKREVIFKNAMSQTINNTSVPNWVHFFSANQRFVGARANNFWQIIPENNNVENIALKNLCGKQICGNMTSGIL